MEHFVSFKLMISEARKLHTMADIEAANQSGPIVGGEFHNGTCYLVVSATSVSSATTSSASMLQQTGCSSPRGSLAAAAGNKFSVH